MGGRPTAFTPGAAAFVMGIAGAAGVLIGLGVPVACASNPTPAGAGRANLEDGEAEEAITIGCGGRGGPCVAEATIGEPVGCVDALRFAADNGDADVAAGMAAESTPKYGCAARAKGKDGPAIITGGCAGAGVGLLAAAAAVAAP